MTEFTKAKIGFALAFLAVLFTISPLVTEFGDKGVDIFNLRLIVRHLYYFTVAALALGVYSYGLQFLTQRNLRFLDSIGDTGYAVAMLAPPAFLAIVVLDGAIAGLATLLPKVAPTAGVVSSLLSAVVGLSSALFSRRIARSVRTLETKSESKQLGHDATALLTRAEDLRRSAMPDLALVEAYKALEVAARKGMVGRRVPYPYRPFDPLRAARYAGLVPEGSHEQLQQVSRWRNKVAHATEPVTDEQAAIAIQLAKTLVAHFELSKPD